MLTQWQANHLSDEVLVSLLDGELPPGKRRAARKHVDRCWACRTRLAELESQIQQFTRLLRDQSDPPPAWIFRARQKFQERARPIRERAERTQVPDRPGWLSSLRLNPGAAAAAVGLLAVLAFLWLHNPDRVSAHELLRQAIASNRNAARVPSGKAVRQRVQVRGRSLRTGREMTAVRECWLGVPPPVAEPAAANPLMDELRGVYRVNGLDWEAPLSVASVARWRAGLRSPSEHVATGDSFVLTVKDRAPSHRDRRQLRSIRLFFRPPDLHPLRQEMETVEAQYEVSEVSYVLVDAPVVERAGRSLASPLPRPAQPQVEPAAAIEAAVSLVNRIRIEFALHEAGACLSSTIRIEDLPGGGLAVRGIVDTGAQKQQLTEALRDLPAVEVLDLNTAAEAARLAAPPPDGAAPLSGGGPRMVLHSTSFALEKRLHAYFRKRGTREAARDRTGLLIDRLLGGVSGAAREAAELKRLANAHPPAALAGLPAASRRLVSTMVRDHGRRLTLSLDAVRDSWITVAEALEVAPADAAPLPHSAPTGPDHWARECESLPASVQQLEARVWELLVHAPESAEAARQLALEVRRGFQESSLQAERLIAAAEAIEESDRSAGNTRGIK